MLMKFALSTIAIAATVAASFCAQAGVVSKPALVPSSQIVKVSDGGDCGWFAISVCSGRRGPAQRAANDYGQSVIKSGDVDGFRAGYYCSVTRSPSKRAATREASNLRRVGARSAYAKYGCE